MACSVTTAFKVRFVYGSGTMADAITAGKYSTFMEMIPAAAKATPIEVMMPRVTCAVDQVWVQFWSETDNATFDFYVGLHEYLV